MEACAAATHLSKLCWESVQKIVSDFSLLPIPLRMKKKGVGSFFLSQEVDRDTLVRATTAKN